MYTLYILCNIHYHFFDVQCTHATVTKIELSFHLFNYILSCPGFVFQSSKRQRLEKGVVFIDDDSELENVTPGPLSWKTESDNQKAGMASPCCVSNVTVHQHADMA